MKEYTLTAEELRALCIKNKWFTCGDNEQYSKLFRANKCGARLEEIASIIWVCSPETNRRDIIRKLKDAQRRYIDFEDDSEEIEENIVDYIRETGEHNVIMIMNYCLGYYGLITKPILRVITDMYIRGVIEGQKEVENDG